MKIGILGGSFDPVHLGHLLIAQEAAEVLGIGVVYFVPCLVPPHKPERRLTEARHRLRMLIDATRGNPRLAVSDIELYRAGPSYSVDTVQMFHSLMGGGTDLYFLVGMDSLAEMGTWHKPDLLFKLARVIVAGRPGFPAGAASPEFRGQAVPVEVTQVDISSSKVRRFVREGRTIRYLVPPEVAGYIRRQGLYR
jgi:nicotinate-nucleotide adenylyltransferase